MHPISCRASAKFYVKIFSKTSFYPSWFKSEVIGNEYLELLKKTFESFVNKTFQKYKHPSIKKET